MVDRRSSSRTYQSWDVKADEIFLSILEDVLNEGNGKTPDGKVKWDIYNKVIEIYNSRTSSKLTRKNVENRQKTWKNLYKVYTKLANQSGWGWDFVNGHTDVPKEIWDEFIQVRI
jgi:hypothetical protein